MRLLVSGTEKKLLDYLDRIGIEHFIDVYNDNKINFDKIKELY